MIFPLVRVESHFNTWISGLTCKRNLSLKLTAWKWVSPLIRFTPKTTTCQIDLRIKSHICTIAWISYSSLSIQIFLNSEFSKIRKATKPIISAQTIHSLAASSHEQEGSLHQHKAAHCRSLCITYFLTRKEINADTLGQHWLKYS